MQALGFSIALIVIIACSIYIYNDYKKNTSKDDSTKEISELGKILLSCLIGGFLSMILAQFLHNLEEPISTQNVILLCTVLCGCTAWIVQTIKNTKK